MQVTNKSSFTKPTLTACKDHPTKSELFRILRIEFHYRGVETAGCYVAELDEKVVGMVAFEKKVLKV